MNFQVFTDKAQEKAKNASNQAVAYFQSHWIDNLLVFFILLVLGAFDIFVLERSDKFLTGEYWNHVGCRMAAYVLAGILGVRTGYPKAKNACQELWNAIAKNGHLIILKEQNSVPFGDFIDQINIEIKTAAWKAKINAKLARLDKFSPNWFPLYYKNQKQEYFNKYRVFKKFMIKRANKYCDKRKTYEALLTDEFINTNIDVISVKFPQVRETDFTQTTNNSFKFKTYHTFANVKTNAARMIGKGIIIAFLIAFLSGSVMFSVDEALAEARAIAIFSIIINAIFDVGITIYKYASARMECPRIVRQEDLRSILDQNEILLRFKKTLSPENISEYDKAVEELKQEEKELAQEQN